MRFVAFDTETERFRPGRMAPELVCLSFQFAGLDAQIIDRHDAHKWILEQLLDPGITLVGHNVAYDLAVLGAEWPDLVPLIFAAYDADRITDTMIRQQLLQIATGTFKFDHHGHHQDYSLEGVAARVAGMMLTKDDLRTSYGALRDVPLHLWSAEALAYPIHDAEATLAVALKQEEHVQYIPSQFHEARAAFWQHLMSCWGLRTDARGVESLRRGTQEALDRILITLQEAGLVRANGKRDTKKAMARMLGVFPDCPRTPPSSMHPDGQPKLDGTTCEDSGDALLIMYAEYTTLNKVLSADVKLLEGGLEYPIHPRLGLAETGRATCSKPNIQNLRRMPGVREAFVPRPGYVIIDADYNTLELWALAQVLLLLFSHSELANVLNSGRDPHTALAAEMLGISYEEAVHRNKDKSDKEFQAARSSQGAKGANFGFPGGLGPVKFVNFAKSGGVAMPADPDPQQDTYFDRKLGHEVYLPGYARACWLRDMWFQRWPEMEAYFQHIGNIDEVVIPGTGMIRAGAPFCARANTYFQGLGAAATKKAGWLIAKACYVDQSSPLFGSRPFAVIHDQFLIETPEGPGAHDAAMEVRKLMRDGAREVMPDCVPDIVPLLSRYWSKNAKDIYDAENHLIPWLPELQGQPGVYIHNDNGDLVPWVKKAA